MGRPHSPALRGRTRRDLALWAFAVALAAWPALARASLADVFGLGDVAAAQAGAVAARSSDFAAAYYNPAGLAWVDRPEGTLGVVGFGSRLTIQGKVRGLDEPFGVVAGAAAPVPLGALLRDRLFVGVALYVVPTTLVRVIARPPEEPFFPYYDNRTQRLLLLPAVALRIGWGITVGVALNYLAALNGSVQAASGATRALEARVDEQISSHLGVNAGLGFRSAAGRLALGLVYRQAFAVPFATSARTRVAGQPIDLAVEAEGLYAPHQLVLGGAWRPRPWLALELDLTGSLWSAWRGPFLAVDSTLPLAGSLTATPPALAYRDTLAVRLGLEAAAPLRPAAELRLRAGYGFETSPIPGGQPGLTNLLDGPKHFVAAGVGSVFDLGQRHDLRLRIDVHGQLQVLHRSTLVKRIADPGTRPDPVTALRDEVTDDPSRPETLGPQISNPGYPKIVGEGFVWSLGLTITVAR